ncbi:hypothetical protein LINPERHAP1_LOCUS29714, partial [Linum perenne]
KTLLQRRERGDTWLPLIDIDYKINEESRIHSSIHIYFHDEDDHDSCSLFHVGLDCGEASVVHSW